MNVRTINISLIKIKGTQSFHEVKKLFASLKLSEVNKQLPLDHRYVKQLQMYSYQSFRGL